MGRKSNYDKQVDAISKRLKEMDHKNFDTVESAMESDNILVAAGLAAPVAEEEYSYCPECRGVCWHGSCSRCGYQAGV